MFDVDTFIGDCCGAVENDPTHKSVAAVMRRAMSDPSKILASLGEPTEPGITPLYQSSNLTIINLAWKPSTTIPPHNHEMWAVIGIYGGREDNIFWRRIKDHPQGLIEAAGAKALSTGDVCPMGAGYHPFCHQSNSPINGSFACLRRRFLRSRKKRMGGRRIDGTPARHGGGEGAIFRIEICIGQGQLRSQTCRSFP